MFSFSNRRLKDPPNSFNTLLHNYFDLTLLLGKHVEVKPQRPLRSDWRCGLVRWTSDLNVQSYFLCSESINTSILYAYWTAELLSIIQLMNLGRVGVVSARPGYWSPRSFIRIDNADNRAICASHHHEIAHHDDKDAPSNHWIPLDWLCLQSPVIVQPHAAVWLEAHQGTEKGADQRDEATKHGNSAGNKVRDNGDTTSTSKPGSPMHKTVGVQMLRSAQDSKENVLGRDLQACVSKMKNNKDWQLTWVTIIAVTIRPGRANP